MTLFHKGGGNRYSQLRGKPLCFQLGWYRVNISHVPIKLIEAWLFLL